MIMGPDGVRTNNDCVGEVQQQITVLLAAWNLDGLFCCTKLYYVGCPESKDRLCLKIK
jgi:hypothetical protein